MLHIYFPKVNLWFSAISEFQGKIVEIGSLPSPNLSYSFHFILRELYAYLCEHLPTCYKLQSNHSLYFSLATSHSMMHTSVSWDVLVTQRRVSHRIDGKKFLDSCYLDLGLEGEGLMFPWVQGLLLTPCGWLSWRRSTVVSSKCRARSGACLAWI